MKFGSEPDISFSRDKKLVATVEVKGGNDPAGALERLGAMSKSFEETPKGCTNFLIAGVITAEMSNRIEKMGVVHKYHLLDVSEDGEIWDTFVKELFVYATRVVDVGDSAA